jgi:uncharacterized protein
MPYSRLLAAVAVVALGLSGCAAVRSYDAELRSTIDYASSGNVDAAIKLLESHNRLPNKDVLYYLELGMLQRLGTRYEESQKAWASAAGRIQFRDQAILTGATNLLRSASSYVVNDKLRAYEGHDYEKVMLLTYMALNHLAIGDYESARVAIKQTHELEAVIAELRAKELAEVEEEARKRGARTNFKELNGYPVETIENPEVNALKNSYQSALSHYLAGFVYEALGEPSLAAPGYRLANELHPGNALLEQALAGLDQRVSAPEDGMTDVLFLIGSGTAPALQSRPFNFFVPVGDKAVLISAAFPVMVARSFSQGPSALTVDGGLSLPVASVTSVDLMARRRLKDEMPSIMLRAAIRATASAVLQYQAQKAGEHKDAAAVAALVVMAGSAVLASADDRTWRMLPSEIAIARARVPAGVHSITVQTPYGPRSARVNVNGRYAVVDFWLLGNQLFTNYQREGTR